jgi:hypothetical protein
MTYKKCYFILKNISCIKQNICTKEEQYVQEQGRKYNQAFLSATKTKIKSEKSKASLHIFGKQSRAYLFLSDSRKEEIEITLPKNTLAVHFPKNK